MDNTGNKRRRVLLISFPAQGHINPSLQFAKRLTRHHVHVTFVTSLSVYRRMPQIPTLPHVSFASYSDGYDDGFKPGDDDPNRSHSEMERLGSEAVKDMITTNAEEGQPFTCVVYSILFPWVAVVARSLHLPSILLWIEPATVFTLYYHYFNGYKDTITQSILDNPSRTIQLPGLPLVTGHDVPSFLLPSNVYDFGFSVFRRLFELLAQQTNPKVLVNTFEALEQDVVRGMDKLHLVPIGPLVPSAFLDCEDPSDASFGGDMFPCSRNNDDYISWLNSNPKAAVVYVSFGSISRLSKEQNEEIASGLLSFGQPFLWVIREEDMGDDTLSRREELEAVGKIVPWCSQLEVLSSPATGCFVTHCGWNSTLESLVCGVPMVGFPQWADQGTNAKIIQDMAETGVRVEVGMDGMVKREEIKRCLEVVMGDSNKGEEIRKKALKWKELAKEAARNGGSSDANFKSQTSDDVLAFLLFSKGVDTRLCASKDAGPKKTWIWGRSHIDGRKERVPARCASKDAGPKERWIWVRSHIDWRKERVPARCASKDAGPKERWIWGRSHIDWRKERVPARRWALNMVDCDVPHWLGRTTNHHL